MNDEKKAIKRRPYAQEDVFRSKHVMDGVLSPDGSFAVYQLSETVPGKTRDEDQQLSSLWRVDLAGGAPRRLTPKGKAAASAQFTPDGGAILFLSARDPAGKVTQIHRLPLAGGEAEAVTFLEQGIASFTLSPDGKWIAFAALEKPPAPVGPGDHIRISRSTWRFDPVPGYLQDRAQAIHLMSAEGGKPEALTPYDGIVQAMAWSPDSRKIAAVILGKADHTTFAMRGDLCVLGRDGECDTRVEKTAIFGHFWTADSKKIGYMGISGDLARQSQLFVVDRDGGAPVSRTGGLDIAVGGLIQVGSPETSAKNRLKLAPDGDRVIAPVCLGGRVSLCSIALDGAQSNEPIVTGPRTCRVFDRIGETLLFSSQGLDTPAELWARDLASGREWALTSHNAEWRSWIDWPRVEHISTPSAAGVEIEGWILTPPRGKPPFKTLLFIHGGPHAAWVDSFNEDFQEMVGAGYAVAFANPRGSTGYGDTFAKAITGCWGRPELEDFEAFLDDLIERGLADADRLGVTGVSGGGHLSAWLIGHTDRYKAAVPEQGVYNMFSMYGVSDAGVDLIGREMDGPPHERPERYWDLSPIAHAHDCKTPTLLIQGENDVRCPMEQAEQLYTVLRRSGCEVELLRLQNCNHGAQIHGPPALRRTRMDALKDWFDRHIP